MVRVIRLFETWFNRYDFIEFDTPQRTAGLVLICVEATRRPAGKGGRCLVPARIGPTGGGYEGASAPVSG